VGNLIEDRYCLSPRIPGSGGIADGIVVVAEVHEGRGFVILVADVPVQRVGVVEALFCLLVLAEKLLRVAECVPDIGIGDRVVDLLL
jgi:hypothetical protein